MTKLVQLTFLILAFSVAAYAEDMRPSVIVNPQNRVLRRDVRLADIATIKAKKPDYDKLIADLGNIKITELTRPLAKAVVFGEDIVAAIKNIGVPLESIGYSVPQTIEIERAGRKLSFDEVATRARQALSSNNSQQDIQIREINWEGEQIIPEGSLKIDFEKLGEVNSGKLPLRVNVSVNNIDEAKFLATALVDSWKEVPVLNKTLERGMLISKQDVELVKVNLGSSSGRIAESVEDVVGRSVKSRINPGEVLNKNMIDIPPLVSSGKKVIISYRSGPLRATASGISLEAGIKDEIIKIKNDNSKKVIKARIISESEVEVLPNE
ncbi:MAG: flagellar basal body P-ring formation protein FlgA [Proteobacteria bacterium]|nr:flagellar basal body P-ring formation protein FlgA [Pseudomonadota bacterium]